MKAAREIAVESLRLIREVPHLDMYVIALTAAIEQRDAEWGEALKVARAALESIEGYDTDWAQGPAGNVASLQNIAAGALARLDALSKGISEKP